jgi:hypothetical protein
MKRTASREHTAMLKWLEQGAPADKDHPLPRPAPVLTTRERAPEKEKEDEAPPRSRKREEAPSRRQIRSPLVAELDAVLARGLASLPLDAKQRARAKALARDALSYFSRPTGARGGAAVQAVAAAVAYAIVYVDHVPLTQAEVAACFRVGVASLRVRFSELRAHLDLMPGDARYATLRRR